jgi:curli production assembly/transport component CsgF
MNIGALIRARMGTIVSILLLSRAAGASDLVYTPINPTFGGNPANGTMLLNNAQAQNDTHAPTLTPLQRFQNSLQQAILNNLASQIKHDLFGTNGNSITPGVYDAGNYTVTVTDNGDGTLSIVTLDNTNGQAATFDVSPTVP